MANKLGDITCCIDCRPPDRRLGCHSTCEKYLKEKEDHLKYLEMVVEGRKAQSAGYSEHLLTHTHHKGKCYKKGQP